MTTTNPSPLKPWEVQQNSYSSTTATTTPKTTTLNSSQQNHQQQLDQAPSRPSTSYDSQPLSGLNTGIGYGGNSTQYSPYGMTNRYSPYSRYGSGYGSTYGSSYGTGAYGGYGSTYGGGYGSGYGGGYGYGTSAYGGGYYGRQMQQQQQPPQLQQEYMSAFQVLEQVVQSFGGLASLMDSTLMAVHSSFMAMVGLAEHYSHLKQIFTDFLSVFSIFSLLARWRGISGSGPACAEVDFTKAFNGSAAAGQQLDSRRKYSRKPIVVFILVFFGLPLILSRIVKHLRRSSSTLPATDPAAGHEVAASKSVQFAKALFDFTAQNPQELSFKRGDLLAVLSAPNNDWWRGKLRHGNVGYFPASYVQIIDKQPGNVNAEKSLNEDKSASASENASAVDAFAFEE